MPSPVGHLVAGVAIAWVAETVEAVRQNSRGTGGIPASSVVTPLVLACAALALAPDLDILLASHRTFSHSLGAVVLAAAACGAIAKARGAPGFATGLICGVAVGGHVLLDWLGRDSNTPRGVMALWPVSTAYFYSGIDLFAEVSRRYWKPDEFILGNAVSVARELVILGPIAAGTYWMRRRNRPSDEANASTSGSQAQAPGSSPEHRAPSPEPQTGPRP